MRDQLQEIFSTLNQNKLRTTLTGLSVSWGIFILIILLGAGNGLKNGVMENFQERAVNRVTLWSGNTSLPFKGLKSGRNLQFSDKELDVVKNEIEESRLITPRANNNQTITFASEFGSYSIRGVMPDYLKIEKLILRPEDGRFVNNLDIKNENKIIVIDKKIEETLFKGKSALGNYVKVDQLMYQVVGINTKKQGWGSPNAYIPFSTYQLIYNPNKKFNNITFTVEGLETKAQNEAFNENLRKEVAQSMNFDAEDQQALYVNNSQEDYIETQKIFGGITMFVAIIGIFTLIAGIVGVSNIMLVSVKERTREIGIRKAIGAPPSSILKLIVLESIIITTIFGYIGMLAGIGVTEVANFVMEQSAAAAAQVATDTPQMSIFKDPTVNLGYVLIATLILIVSGVVAGYLPAYKAVRVKPIEAMRKD
ncbi:MAG: ABC transporter permease [Bacteroidales bacterium]|nr:ABC transporter permease [Bacteroidales bacterium]